jgi:hypothetical protein
MRTVWPESGMAWQCTLPGRAATRRSIQSLGARPNATQLTLFLVGALRLRG